VEVPSMFIDGQELFLRGDGALSTHNPSTGRALAQITAASREDIDAATTAAREASPDWARRSPRNRGRMLLAAAEAIRGHARDLAELDIENAGIPRSLAYADVETAACYFEYYGGLADKVGSETIPLGDDFIDYTVREPWGVCGVIVPFNFPLRIAARDIAAALAAGNSVVVKVSEMAPWPVLGLVSVLAEGSGLPRGVLNAFTGDRDAGEYMTREADFDHLTFTGSVETGRRVAESAGGRLIPTTLELGGKSPQVVFADANLEKAAAAVVGAAFRTAGQACNAGTRILVEEGAFNAFADALQREAEALRVGDAASDPDVGPVISSGSRDRIVQMVRDSVDDGASLLTRDDARSAAPEAEGYFVQPTILLDPDPGSRLNQTEIFGPVIAMAPFSQDAEALEFANASSLGLVAGVWTSSIDRALGLTRALKVGQVFVNTYGVGADRDVALPFGGYRHSGIGRAKGVAGMKEYTQLKNVCLSVPSL